MHNLSEKATIDSDMVLLYKMEFRKLQTYSQAGSGYGEHHVNMHAPRA